MKPWGRQEACVLLAHKEHLDRAVALAGCYLSSSESVMWGQQPDYKEVGDETKYTEDPGKGHTGERIAGAESQGFLQAGSCVAKMWQALIAAGANATTWRCSLEVCLQSEHKVCTRPGV